MTFAKLMGTGFVAVLAAELASAQTIRLNEIYASHAGTDNQEFIELIGPAGASLNDYGVLVVEGDGAAQGTLDRVFNLTGFNIPPTGFFVLGNTAVTPNHFDIGPDNILENGTETFYLVQGNIAVLAGFLGTNVAAGGSGTSGTTLLPALTTLVDVVALIDTGVAGGTDTVYDVVWIVGPDGDFFPSGIFRKDDFPNDWCTGNFLDFDNVANMTQPRTPGASNSPAQCLNECFLVFGDGPGLTPFQPFDHQFLAQLGNVTAYYPTLMAELPEFLLPTFHTNTPLGAQWVGNFYNPQGIAQYYAQILMWSPQDAPAQPEQWSQGLRVVVMGDGTMFTRYWGHTTGIRVMPEIVVNDEGQNVLRFPFHIPGF
jgi:hypothetical protein